MERFSQNQGSPKSARNRSGIRSCFFSLGSPNVSHVLFKDKSMIQLNCNTSFDCIAFRSLDPNTDFLRRIVRLQHPCRAHALWYEPGTAVNNMEDTFKAPSCRTMCGKKCHQHRSAERSVIKCHLSHKPTGFHWGYAGGSCGSVLRWSVMTGWCTFRRFGG